MTNPDPDPEAMHADAALYASKKVGHGQHKFFKDQKSDLTIQYKKRATQLGRPFVSLSAHNARQPQDQLWEAKQEDQPDQLDHHELHHAKIDVL